MKKILLACWIGILLIGCEGNEGHRIPAESQGIDSLNINVPQHIRELERLRVYSPDNQDYDTVTFKQEQVFESNEEVFIKGNIGEVAIDKRDRVYVTGENIRNVGIYVFERDGSYLATIGRFGRGPGERSQRSVMAPSFQVIIKNGYLYSAERDIGAGIDRIVKYKIQLK